MSILTLGKSNMSIFDDLIPKAVESFFEVFKPNEPKKPAASPVAKNYKIPEPPKDLVQKTKWVSRNEKVEVNGVSICGPMFYTGSKLENSNGYPEPSLVNPILKTSTTIDDASYAVDPSYMKFTPNQRYKYLEWLASDCTTKAPNAFVLLYFYGLERRALIDGLRDQSVMLEVRPEIERLANRYGVLSVYAEPLLLHIDLILSDNKPLTDLNGTEPAYATGRYAAQRQPVPPELIGRFILASNHVRKSKYISTCPELVEKVVVHSHSDGITLDKCFTFKNLDYRAVSHGLRGIPFVYTSKALDISTSRSNLNRLQDISTMVSDCLEDYSKYLIKNPTHSNTLEANLMLPSYLYPENLRHALSNLRFEAERNHLVDMPIENLLSTLGSCSDLDKSKYARVVSALNSNGVGIYPETVKSAVDVKSTVILYALSSAAPNNSDYDIAELFIDVLAWASSKDVKFEDTHIFEKIMCFDIGENESKHLAAVAKFKCINSKNPSGLKQKIKDTLEPARRKIADLFVALVKNDELEPDDIKLLESVFKLLDLDQNDLYSALHSDSSVQVQKSDTLDMSKIKALQQETSEVSSMLHAIFNTEDDPIVDIEKLEPEMDSVIDTTLNTDQKMYIGLNVKVSLLIDIIKTKPFWKKSDLKAHADELGLMIDGVIEQINDACFDSFDDPLIDGDDPLEINQDILNKVLE